jgi:gliding motility-associated-like protein
MNMLRRFLLITCFSFAVLICHSQDFVECPPNLGFEEGTLNHWDASTAKINYNTTVEAFIPGVVNGRHTLIKKNSGRDPYGGFSTDSPNGSEYVIRLGDKNSNADADRISYTIKVPLNVESYAIAFNYALVLQNPPHDPAEQPKFTVVIIDETSNTINQCASFEYTSRSGLPGFQPANDEALFKPWSAVLVNLTQYLGHTIRMEFTSYDCSEAAHFGYAYIDFNENCATPITGNVTCPESNSLTLNSFPGFDKYRWYDPKTLVEYGTTESIRIDPTPPIGTKIAVELTPYPYSGGCVETLYTEVKNMGDIQIKGPLLNCFSIDLTAPSVVGGNRAGITYSYFKDSQALIPLPDPKAVKTSGTYYIMGRLLPSGCFSIMPVDVKISPLPPIKVNPPEPVKYPAKIDLTKTFTPEPGVKYTYWIDQSTKRELTSPTSIDVGGIFYIKGVDTKGCIVVTAVRADITLPDIVIPNTFTPNGDGINDVLTVLLDSRIRIEYFKIFNRWGQQVYETSDINKFWNGYRGNANPLPGIYYWVLAGEEDRRKYIRKGSVTIIR